MADVRIAPSWKGVLTNEFSAAYWVDLTQFVRAEYATGRVYPPPKLVFNAFDLCSFDSVKVVILGQDPYHGAGQAHGLAFSVPVGVRLPPSLQNINKELAADLEVEPLSSGDLSVWARQGVLLTESHCRFETIQIGSG